MEQMQQGTMAMLIIPADEWQNQQARLERVESLLAERNQGTNDNEWLDSNTARQLLHISQKTWQTYRDNKVIPFAQFGRKIMVKKSDIEAFLQAHFISK